MRDLPLSNGRLAVDFDDHYRLRDVYFPRVGQENHTLGRPSCLGVRIEGAVFWVDASWERSLVYGDRSGRVTDVRLARVDLGVEILVSDTVLSDLDLLRRRFRVRATGPLRVLVHHDFRILENDLGNGVRYDRTRGALVHFKRDRYFLLNLRRGAEVGIRAWTLGRHDDRGGRGVRGLAEGGDLDLNPVAVGAGESLIGIDVTPHAGQDAEFELWMAAGRTREEVEALDDAARRPGPDANPAPRRIPAPTSDLQAGAERLFDLSIAIAGSQISHDGAIIASSDSELCDAARESYAYVWPRDGALVGHALELAGRKEPRDAFLHFCARVMTPDGWLHQRYHPDGTPASTWHPDREPGDPALPLQADETALAVWAASRPDRDGGRPAADDRLFADLVRPGAEFLVRYREPHGLPFPSHDLWEERFGIHTFTVAATAAALQEAAATAASRGDRESADRWRTAGDEVTDAMTHHLYHRDAERFARSAHREADGGYFLDLTPDASLAGLFLFDPTAAVDSRVIATMDEVAEALTVATPIGGVARYAGDRYHARCRDAAGVPGNPWIITTLWLADWKIARARRRPDLAEARALIEWVVSRARPSGALPEQLHPLTGEHLSVRPLTWSHAEFIRTVDAYRLRWAELR